MRRRFTVESDALQRLREDVENYISRRLSSPNDFLFLSDQLQASGIGYVSPTTLKRIWGYINDTEHTYTPSAYSLRMLCNLIGFRDMEEFLDASSPIQSKEYSGKFIESRKLPEDARVLVRWSPNRRCVLRHLKATLFEVEEVENARLRKDDIVECGCFTQNAPLYFTRVFRKGCSPLTYIAGSANGISYSILPT